MASTGAISASNLFTLKYSSASVVSSSVAIHGATSGNGNQVGIMNVSGMPSMYGKVITGITLTFTCGPYGGGSSTTKTLYLYGSYKTSYSSSDKGEDYVGTSLGSVSGTFYNNTRTVTLNSTTNKNTFEAVANFIKTGGRVFVMYDSGASVSGTYSANYLGVTAFSVNVTYGNSSDYQGVPSVQMNGATVSSASVGSTVDIAMAVKDDTYKYKLEYQVQGGTKTLIANNVTKDGTEWTIPDTLEVGKTCYVYATTYDADGNIVTSDAAFTTFVLAAPPSVPIIDDVTIGNADNELEDQFGSIIQAKSYLKITMLFTHSGDIEKLSQWSLTVGGTTVSGNDFEDVTIEGVDYKRKIYTTVNPARTAGTNVCEVTVTDTDGAQATQSVNYNVLSYYAPQITGFKAEKNGTKIKYSINASIAALYKDSTHHNTYSCKLYYKEADAEDFDPTDVINVTGFVQTGSAYVLTIVDDDSDDVLDSTKNYSFKVEVKDYFATVERTGFYAERSLIMDFPNQTTGKVRLYRGMEFNGQTAAELLEAFKQYIGVTGGYEIVTGTTEPTSLQPNQIYLMYEE